MTGAPPPVAVRIGGLVGAVLLVAGCAPDVDEAKRKAVDSAVRAACASTFDWSDEQGRRAGEERLREIVEDANAEHSPWSDLDVLTGTGTVTDEMERACPETIDGYDTPLEIPTSDTPTTSEPTPEPEPEPTPEPAPDTEGMSPELVERGLTRPDVVELGRMADVTGYGLSPETPLSFEQAADFAFVLLDTCDEAAADGDWEARIAEDMEMGAPLEEATRMNDYLRDVFCPKVT